jgi:hypothetical protein
MKQEDNTMIKVDPMAGLAASRLISHMHFVRNLRAGKAMPLLRQQGRPGRNTNRYDARTVRYIDTERSLSSIGNPEFGWMVRHVVDGESIHKLAIESQTDMRVIENSIRCSLQIFADELLKRDWL